MCVCVPPTLRLVLLAVRGSDVAAVLHGAEDVSVVRVQVVVETHEVKLRVPRLLGFQDNLKLRPMLAQKVGGPLDDGVGLGGRRL